MLGKTNQVLKKLVYAGIVAAVFLAGAAGKALSAPDSNSIVIDDIEFYVETDKSIYYLGENIQMLYRLTNLGFPSAIIPCYQTPPLNLVVRKDGEAIWMEVQGWWMVPVDLRLWPMDPCEIASYWDMNDFNGVPVGPGTYDVFGVIYDTIGIPDVGVQITILPVPRTITVGLGAGYDFNTIQAAIDDAYDGDTIIVADGIYTGDGNRDIDFFGKAITLRSENGPENCIIDCNGTEAEPHRSFCFHCTEDANSVLDGFSITHGHASGGGGMLEGSSGGIYCNGSSPRIINCIVSENSAAYYGGGMSNCESSPMLINCIFSGNSANSGGGGIFNFNHSSPKLINCILKANSAIGNGGGMCNEYNSKPTLINCTFNGNSTDMWDGGGIYNHESDPTLINCMFTGNSAYNCGGGIRNDGGDPPPTNNLFRDNLNSDVDMTRNFGCDLILTNCTFFANSATHGNAMACNSYGGVRPSNVRITNSILCNGGNEIWNNDNSTITITYSNVQDGWPGTGNINSEPFFADPCNGDYHLKSQAGRWDANTQIWVQDDLTSACVDAGNPGCPLADEPAPNGNRRNMGAYGGTDEASKSPDNWRSIADLTNDWVVDSNDLKVFIDYWLNTGECIPGDLNRNQSTNSADFALLANNWLRSSPGKSVFDFAVATKGPLSLASNIEIDDVSIFVNASVYIESQNSSLALEMIGNSHIAGDVFIVNPFCTVNIQGGDASIGGETAPGAYDHVFYGVYPIEFPVPNPDYFEHYVVEDINLAETTFTNVRVPPNTNPSFGAGVTFYGILFIKTPNLVTFSGNVNITGVIVGDGDVTDDSGINRIDFLSTVNSNSVDTLPEEFGDLREETGTFLMAPGFSLSFNGDLATINGAIAANGVVFSGNAGGTIQGSVLNYSDTEMELSSNNYLFFNRYVNTEMPAGFE